MENNEDIEKVREILEDYKRNYKKERDNYVKAYQNFSKLDEGFELLLLNIELDISNNTFEKHWYRMPKEILINYKTLLFKHRKEFYKKDSFASIYSYIWEISKKEFEVNESKSKKDIENKLNWVGPVVVYDTAFKIGIFFGLFPEKMYIFAGIKIGVDSLTAIGIVDEKKMCIEEVGVNTKKYKIYSLVELPAIFKESDMKYYELSNCWCKKRIEGAKICINSKNKNYNFKISNELNSLFYQVFASDIKKVLNIEKKHNTYNNKRNKVVLKIENKNETQEVIENKIKKSKYCKYIQKYLIDIENKKIEIVYKEDVYNEQISFFDIRTF